MSCSFPDSMHLGVLPYIFMSWRATMKIGVSPSENCDQLSTAAAELKNWYFLLDVLVVTFTLLRNVTDTCQPNCLLCLQCKWFWKLTALCICLWTEFSSFLFIWHFRCFYLELSHEFLLRKILLGEELKDKNRDPSGLQTERLERSGKAFGRDGNAVSGWASKS